MVKSVIFGALLAGEFEARSPGRKRPALGDPVASGNGGGGRADRRWAAGFVSAIEDCVSAGRAPQVDPRSAATRLWAGLHGMTVLRVSKKGFPWPSVERLVEELLTDLVLDSVLLTTGETSEKHRSTDAATATHGHVGTAR
jgi:hypothetical protein